MTLLRDIQQTAIDSNASLSTLLRKCKVLAARLGNSEFKNWVENELNGYGSREDLPEYRILRVNSKGNFSGPYGSGLKNADIPLSCIDADLREGLSHSYLTSSVASFEELLNKVENGAAREPWSPDLVAYVGQGIYERMTCLQAWKVIPTGAIVGALDSVRNRVLSFALEIEAEAPGAGDAPINSIPVAPERVNQIFNTFITGSVQNVATGGQSVRQNASQVSRGSDELFSKLLDAIHRVDADRALIAALASSVEEMRASQGSAVFREHYQKFMGMLADHMQVLGVAIGPFLPALSAMLP